DQEDLHQDEGSVPVDAADRPADRNDVRGHGAEGQQEEEGRGKPEQRLPELIADFEREDAPEHRRQAAFWSAACRVEKYTSSRSAGTSSNDGSGRAWAITWTAVRPPTRCVEITARSRS